MLELWVPMRSWWASLHAANQTAKNLTIGFFVICYFGERGVDARLLWNVLWSGEGAWMLDFFWETVVPGFCKVEFVCFQNEPNWLGWIILGCAGLMLLGYAFFVLVIISRWPTPLKADIRWILKSISFGRFELPPYLLLWRLGSWLQRRRCLSHSFDYRQKFRITR